MSNMTQIYQQTRLVTNADYWTTFSGKAVNFGDMDRRVELDGHYITQPTKGLENAVQGDVVVEKSYLDSFGMIHTVYESPDAYDAPVEVVA